MRTIEISITAVLALGLGATACSGPPAPAANTQPAAAADAEEATGAPPAVLDQQVTSLDGEPVDLGDYRGSVLLVVNTASKCGYTPQYAGLEELYQRYRNRGLMVIGFPSNDFANQEPGTAEEIATFCRLNYGVSFPMMAKVATKGPDRSPVYAALTEGTPEGIRGEIRWNFTKFLVDRDGRVVARFEPKVEPLSDELVSAVERLL